jgi:hypothetical protein
MFCLLQVIHFLWKIIMHKTVYGIKTIFRNAQCKFYVLFWYWLFFITVFRMRTRNMNADIELYLRYSTQKSPECEQGMNLGIVDTIQN